MLRISPLKIKTVGLPAALLLVIVLFSGQLLAAPGHAERPGDCTSGSTINLNNWRSAPLLSPNVLENAISSFSPGFLFAPTVTDHKITPGPIPSACVSPNGKTNYLQTDPAVYQWTLINGGSVGDVIQWQFFAPGTLTPYSQQQTTLNFSGAACFWAGINIAGQSAASLLGTWQVRVLYNGSLLLTDSFTINSSLPAVTVSDHRVSSGPIPANCIPPVNQTSFLATEAQIYEWILFTGVQTGDVIRWEFVQPNGTVYQAQEFTSTFSGASGCFWSSISLAGQAAASLPGNWQVKVYYNTVLKQTDAFTITTIACPSVSSISPSTAAAGASIQINGTNLSNVSAVRFSGNAAAQYSVVSSSQLSVVVPAGAASGPITLVSTGCSDVQTPAFTLIPNNPVPAVTTLSPASATAGASAFTLTVTGSNFVNGSSIRWNGSDRVSTFVNATTLTASITAADIASAGSSTVSVFNPAPGGGTSNTLPFTINVPCPAGVAANPSSGASGTTVTISGTNLSGVTGVRFAGNVAAQFTVVSGTQINATVPAGASTGVITVSKTGCADIQTGSFTVLQPHIVVGQSILNFGSVKVFKSRDLQLSVQNTGNAPLTLSSMASTNLQYNIIGASLPVSIAPGSQQLVTIRFAPGLRGDHPAKVTLSSNDPATPLLDVSLSGKGVAPVIKSVPASIGFGSVPAGQRSRQTLTLSNPGDLPLSISTVTTSDPQFTINTPQAGLGLPAGNSITLNVTFLPTSSGLKNAVLTLNSDDPITPRLDIALTGTGIAPAIVASPNALSFGSLRVSQSQDLILTVSNSGQSPLRISSVTSDNSSFFVTQILARGSNATQNLPVEVVPGNAIDITVRFRPRPTASSIGALTGVLSLVSNDPARPKLDIQMTGTGLGAAIAASSSISFPAGTACAGPVPATLSITNTGNSSLTISRLTLDQSAFSFAVPPSVPFSIGPGASTSLGLRFSSPLAGTVSGLLTISSNAINASSLAIPLSGTTVAAVAPPAPAISLSRTTLSHGRADETRGFSVFNPFGLSAIIGFAFPGGVLPDRSISPGALPMELFTAIAASPNPLHITLTGGVSNPIVLSAANLPSSFTLAVAEGVSAINSTRWDRSGTRFGSGNLYASVSIPGTGIVAGQELVTEADLDAYTANSIIYEAPAFGLVVAPAGQNGGTATVTARARLASSDFRCRTLFSPAASAQAEFSRTVRLEILPDRTQVIRAGGALQVTVAAQISGNFDPATNTTIRFALKLNGGDIIADDPETINASAAPRITSHTFIVPASRECQLAELMVVASSTGNVSFAPPPLNPFLETSPEAVGLFTFRSGGSTVEDVRSILVTAPDSNCGAGLPVGWVRGDVIDASTGLRIVGALVSVEGTSLLSNTGEFGDYFLNNVPTGARSLKASAPGFNDGFAAINVVAGQITVQDIQLNPVTGSIAGIVLNGETLQAFAGARITIKGTNRSTTSGADGRYALAAVPIGNQSVVASANGFQSDEEPVTVIADQTSTQDFFLIPQTGSIIGFVYNTATSQPLAGAQVKAAGISGTTGADGTFQLNRVPVGTQTVTATAPGFTAANIDTAVLDDQASAVNLGLTPQTGTLTGTIRDPELNPVSGATVTLVGLTGTAITGADGAFTFTDVPPGTQTVSANASGFRPASATATVLSNQTAVRDVILDQIGGTLKGTITDATNLKAVKGASVEILPFPLNFGISDTAGSYALADVPVGQQVVLASAPGYFSKLAVVSISANSTTVQNFALVPQVGHLQGVVYDKNSQVVDGATLVESETGQTVTTDGSGSYTFIDMKSGVRSISVSKSGFTTQSFNVQIVTDQTQYQDIYLDTPLGSVQGTVKDASTNQPIAGAILLVGVPYGAIYYSAVTDAAGNYTLTNVKAGTLTIYAGADGYIAANSPVTVIAGQVATSNFSLSPDLALTTGTVTGVVRSSASGNPPVAGAQVTLASSAISAFTQADGSYTLQAIPAGAQTINVSKAGFQTASASVTVTAGQTVTQDFTMTPGSGTVTGLVRNAANANPLPGVSITIIGTSISATSGADGSYTLTNVPVGAQTLNAAATGFISSAVQVTVTDGQSVTQNLSLSPTLPPGEIRITLNWQHYGGSAPNDLDMHLVGPNPDGSCFELYYRNLGNLTASPFALLEVDNVARSVCSTGTNCPTTETMHIGKLSPGIYRFFVQNYGGEDADGLSRSKATVQIIGSTGTLGSFTVPSGTGFTWTVFEINGTTGVVTQINQLASPSFACK